MGLVSVSVSAAPLLSLMATAGSLSLSWLTLKPLASLLASVVGSGLMWTACLRVLRGGCRESDCDVAIEASKLSFLLVLLGFF